VDTHKQDVVTLIELLKMAAEHGRVLKLTTFRKATCSVKITPCLRCGRKRADAPESEGVNFRPE
jgi:hypothetical protein